MRAEKTLSTRVGGTIRFPRTRTSVSRAFSSKILTMWISSSRAASTGSNDTKFLYTLAQAGGGVLSSTSEQGQLPIGAGGQAIGRFRDDISVAGDERARSSH